MGNAIQLQVHNLVISLRLPIYNILRTCFELVHRYLIFSSSLQLIKADDLQDADDSRLFKRCRPFAYLRVKDS